MTQLDNALSDAHKQLEDYRTLSKGWDGYSGVPFDSDVIDIGKRFLNHVANYLKQHQVVGDFIPGPTGDGSLDIEIKVVNKTLILTFYPESRIQSNIVGVFKSEQVRQEHKDSIEYSKPLFPIDLQSELDWLVQ